MKHIPSNSVRKTALPAALDQTDFAILDALQNNARLSNKELAAKVGLAPSSCLVRFRKLVKAKMIRGFYADVDPALLRPAANNVLQRWPVSRRVNSSRAPADDPSLIERVEVK